MFSLFVLSVLAAAVSALPYDGRIYGGKAVSIKDYPYQVSVEVYSSHFCGGSIVSKNHVITAAHCTEEYTADILSIRAGSSLINQGGSVHRVVRIIPHERYHENSQGTPVNDIAIIEVAEPFEFDDTRQPIALYNEVARPDTLANISGWGLTESGYTEILMATQVPIYDKVKCDNVYYILFGGITDGQICAADYGVGGKDTCQGDSGGPLAIDGRLAGIVSWGFECAEPRWPGVYTEIAYFRQWIEKHIQL